MFARLLEVIIESPEGRRPAPLAHLDSFAMRGFTGESRFDATLPRAAGEMEAGLEVPLPELARALEDWFRRKGYLRPGENLRVRERPRERSPAR